MSTCGSDQQIQHQDIWYSGSNLNSGSFALLPVDGPASGRAQSEASSTCTYESTRISVGSSCFSTATTDCSTISVSGGSSGNSPSSTARANKPRASARGNGKGDAQKSKNNAQRPKDKACEVVGSRKGKGKQGRTGQKGSALAAAETEGKGGKGGPASECLQTSGKIHIPPHQKNVPRRTDFIAQAVKKQAAGITTVMLRNIPNRYTNTQLIQELNDEGFAGTYNFLYVPIDFRNNCNVGYSFINFLTEEVCQSFTEHMEGYQFQRFNSAKRASCVPAYVQGLEANVEHYRSTLVGSDEPLHRPVVFQGGQQITVRQAECLFSPNDVDVCAELGRQHDSRNTTKEDLLALLDQICSEPSQICADAGKHNVIRL